MNSKLSKWMTTAFAGLLVTAGVAIADEAEVKVSDDTTKNPVTGTVTEKKKVKKKKKVGDHKATSEASSTKKTTTDGDVQVKEKTESETSAPN
jgi:hypothetical protein